MFGERKGIRWTRVAWAWAAACVWAGAQTDQPIPDPQPQAIQPGQVVQRAYKQTGVPYYGETLDPFVRFLMYTPPGYKVGDTSRKWPVVVAFRGDEASIDKPSDQAKDVDIGTLNWAFECYQWNGISAILLNPDHKKVPILEDSLVCIWPLTRKDPPEGGYELKWIACMVRDAMARYNLDPSRLYLTGLCAGAATCFKFAYQMPAAPAAMALFAFPGEGKPYQDGPWINYDHVHTVAKIPTRVWTDKYDTDYGQMDYHNTLKFQDLMNASVPASCEVFLSGDGKDSSDHDCWSTPYAGQMAFGTPPETLYRWFLDHRRGAPTFDPAASGGPSVVALRPAGPARGAAPDLARDALGRLGIRDVTQAPPWYVQPARRNARGHGGTAR